MNEEVIQQAVETTGEAVQNAVETETKTGSHLTTNNLLVAGISFGMGVAATFIVKGVKALVKKFGKKKAAKVEAEVKATEEQPIAGADANEAA